MAKGGGSRSSIAFDEIPEPDFADAVIVAIPPSSRPLETDPAFWAKRIFSVGSAPVWVKVLLAVRQAFVRFVGLSRADSSVFDIDRIEGDEALITDRDTHLDFAAAVRVDAERHLLFVTTAVRLHGWRGRIYWMPVSLLHGPVTRSMARRAVDRYFSEGI